VRVLFIFSYEENDVPWEGIDIVFPGNVTQEVLPTGLLTRCQDNGDAFLCFSPRTFSPLEKRWRGVVSFTCLFGWPGGLLPWLHSWNIIMRRKSSEERIRSSINLSTNHFSFIDSCLFFLPCLFLFMNTEELHKDFEVQCSDVYTTKSVWTVSKTSQFLLPLPFLILQGAVNPLFIIMDTTLILSLKTCSFPGSFIYISFFSQK